MSLTEDSQGSAEGQRRSPLPTWFVASLLGLSLFLVYAATANYTRPQSIDTGAMLQLGWRLGTAGSANLTGVAEPQGWVIAHGDAVLVDRFPGAAFFSAPFYTLLGSGESATIYSAAIASAAAAATAMALLFLLLCRLANRRLALAATLLMAFGTGTWTASADALWTHGPGQLWLLAATLLIARKTHFGAGLSYAAAVFTRPRTAVVAACSLSGRAGPGGLSGQ